MTTVTADPQMGLEEQTLNDPVLLTLIEDYMEYKDSAREYGRAKRQIKKFRPQAEGRYRIGQYVLTISAMSGGGFSIKPWTALVSRVTPATGSQ